MPDEEDQAKAAAVLRSDNSDEEKAAAASASTTATAAAAVIDDGPRSIWSTAQKVVASLVLCTQILSLTYASSAWIISSDEIQETFKVSRTFVEAGITVYVAAFAAGPLLFGPASDLYGRRIVYICAGALYSAASFAVAFAPSSSPASVLIFRFFMGFFGSASINNAIASIGDFTWPIERMKYNVVYALLSFGGPALGPWIGAYIQVHAGFRWNVRVMAIFATVTSCLVFLVPETHAATLAARKAARQGAPAPHVPLSVALATFRLALWRPLFYLFAEPIITVTCLYLALLYACLYSFFGAFPYVFLDIRGFSLVSYGETYISLGLGFLAGFVAARTRAHFVTKQMMKLGDKTLFVKPESRLSFAIPGAILAPISLTIFAWTAPYPNVHWIAPCIGEFLFSFSMFSVYAVFVPFLGETYPKYSASALASGMSSRALLASFFPLFMLQAYQKLTVQGASMLLAAATALLAPTPVIFMRNGSKMRARSQYAVHDPL